MNHDYALDNTDQQEAREARRDPAYWAEDAGPDYDLNMAKLKARQFGVSPEPFVEAMLEREDLDRRIDAGEYEGDWLERQDNRHSCPYCFGTGLAPGDGRTECGFCCHG